MLVPLFEQYAVISNKEINYHTVPNQTKLHTDSFLHFNTSKLVSALLDSETSSSFFPHKQRICYRQFYECCGYIIFLVIGINGAIIAYVVNVLLFLPWSSLHYPLERHGFLRLWPFINCWIKKTFLKIQYVHQRRK